MTIKEQLQEAGIDRLLDYVIKDPEANSGKLLKAADKFLAGKWETQLQGLHTIVDDPENPYHQLIVRLLRDTDADVIKTVVKNFFLNIYIRSWNEQEGYREEYGCNIPWAILLDPTSACNLRCTGCWAGEYGNRLNLSCDEIDDIIEQGKELGIYMYIYTGGEPLVRKHDLIRLAEKHSDCMFLCFTNATLIDEAFADELLRVRNFVPAISLEGFQEATDSRRGEGTYQKVIGAIELLHSKKLLYGISACYTSANFESITSEAFYDSLIDLGVGFLWYFHYMPVGNNAVPELMVTPEQRTLMVERLNDYRGRKPLFAMDFQNDGVYVDGCIAGGRRYLHINANGDMDPCVFIHYSDSNIREKTLLEGLQSPLFMAYHDKQPFNENHYRPCPMLENPEILRRIVKETGAKSTDLESPESVDHLCAKCDAYAANWQPVADELWERRGRKIQANLGTKNGLSAFSA